MDNLCEQLSSYLKPGEIERVRGAYHFAVDAHDGQFRVSGDPYVTHPLAVAGILGDMHMDHHCLEAAMVHDVIEDCGVTKDQMVDRFGQTTAELVDGVSKLNRMEYRGATRAEQQAENFQKMVLAMSRDLRVILVKLADRLHNMRTLGALQGDRRRRIARETLEIYAPIARRLGINNFFIELEELGFRHLHPLRARRLEAALKKARGHRRDLVLKVQEALQNHLRNEGFIVQVDGREKHLYSIYQKMRQKRKSFQQIMDVFGFRVIADSVDSCYRILGLVHNLFQPRPGSFKDYIAMPKSNGYQSLHSVLMSSAHKGLPIELQIRTREMDAIANYGIAAHWHYKSGGSGVRGPASLPGNAQQWVHGLLDMHREAGDPMEFIEHVKADLFPRDVYVFTPGGRIIELPDGATPLDFAYAVHTDVGNSYVSCRINGAASLISEPLQSGQVVDIETDEGSQPRPEWLNFAVTARARSAIRHYLKYSRDEESVRLGRALMDEVLGAAGTSLAEVSGERMARLLTEARHDDFDEVLEQIGLGNRSPWIVARSLLDGSQRRRLRIRRRNSPVVVASAGSRAITFGVCCRPIPGDPILAHFSPDRGIVVHRTGCHNIASHRKNPELCMPINWVAEPEGEFYAEMVLEVRDYRRTMAIIVGRIDDCDGSIAEISSEQRDFQVSRLRILVQVKNRVHLATIMRRLRTLAFITGVKRSRG